MHVYGSAWMDGNLNRVRFAEELMVIANKRLCNNASQATREVVRIMCKEAVEVTPEFGGLLVPMCKYHGGVCHEIFKCFNKNY